MTAPSHPRLHRAAQTSAQLAGAFVLLVGVLVLAGWMLERTPLGRLHPRWIGMPANTALGLVVGAVALRLAGKEQPEPWRRRLALACAGLTVLLGLLTLGEYLLDRNLGLSQLLGGEPPAVGETGAPEQLRPIISLVLLPIGLALVLWWLSPLGSPWPAQSLTLGAAFLSFFALIGSLYDLEFPPGLAASAHLPWPTAATFLVFCAGILLATPDRGLTALVTSTGVGGVLVRRVLPTSVVLPLVLGWLALQGERAELYTREVGLALFALTNVAVFIALVCWNADSLEQAEAERQRIETIRLETERALLAAEKEFDFARVIQQRLFPAAAPEVPGFDISGASFPAVATGGDYFDYLRLGNDCLGIVVADVSGHGFGPALLMAGVRAYLRALALTRAEIGEIVPLVNRALFADTSARGFATLLLAQLDPKQRTLHYISAGHMTGYVLDRSGAAKALLEGTALPLGLEPEAAFALGPTIQLEAGDIIFLPTDGIIEARAADASWFDTERALGVIRANREKSAREIIDALFAAIRHFCRDQTPHDDMTTIVIKVNALPGS
jgi:serine phosphatase RsbU (regulator of sigma subunit)